MTQTKPAWIGIQAARAYAAATLAAPHRKTVNGRLEAPGEPVFVGVAPLPLCPRRNELLKEPHWAAKERKRQLLQILSHQAGRRWYVPLPGRPIVHAVRFSVKAPDSDAGWEKSPVDALVKSWSRGKKTHHGLGVLLDDAPEFVDRRTWWEYAPAAAGFVLISVYPDPMVLPE